MSEGKGRRLGCLILPFLLLLIPVYAFQTAVNVVVNETASAELSFSINPISAYQNQNIDFIVTVENTGNVMVSAQPEVKIYRGEVLIANLTFESANIPIRSNVTFVASWNTNNLGDYTAMAIVYYDNKTLNATQSFSISAPPTAPVARGVAISPAIEKAVLRYTKHPVLAELRPGESMIFDVMVENPTKTSLHLDTNVSGIPWVDVFPSTIEVSATSTATFRIYASIPFNASPDDHKVTIRIGNGLYAETFFILRVKPYPIAYTLPTVTRVVIVDTERQTTHVYLKVTNYGGFVKKLEIVENIPKQVVSDVDVHQIYFDIPPQIIERNVVKWTLEGLQTGEVRMISYSIPIVLDEYFPYVYWSVRQINAFYTKPEIVKLSCISPSSIAPGESGEVQLILTNLDVESLSIVAKIDVPSDWLVSPREIKVTIPTGSSHILTFFVTPPPNAKAANYHLVLRLTYDNREIIEHVFIPVQPQLPFYPLALVLLMALLIVSIGILYLKRRAKRAEQK
jgi:hypothetical protein